MVKEENTNLLATYYMKDTKKKILVGIVLLGTSRIFSEVALKKTEE